LKEAGGLLTDLQGKQIADDVKVSGLSIVGTKNRELQERILETINS
jgi:fructose-1,6-bisphosphatase/inositol monophosphatase family enzyme